MSDHCYGHDFGRIMGYPPCCVDEFMSGQSQGKTRTFSGTGYIPCTECDALAQLIGPDTFVGMFITPNRAVVMPFPYENDEDRILVKLDEIYGIQRDDDWDCYYCNGPE